MLTSGPQEVYASLGPTNSGQAGLCQSSTSPPFIGWQCCLLPFWRIKQESVGTLELLSRGLGCRRQHPHAFLLGRANSTSLSKGSPTPKLILSPSNFQQLCHFIKLWCGVQFKSDIIGFSFEVVHLRLTNRSRVSFVLYILKTSHLEIPAKVSNLIFCYANMYSVLNKWGIF